MFKKQWRHNSNHGIVDDYEADENLQQAAQIKSFLTIRENCSVPQNENTIDANWAQAHENILNH